MLKKITGLIVVLLTLSLYLINLPFVAEKGVITCFGGKSSGSFKSGITLNGNDGFFISINDEQKVYDYIKKLNCKWVLVESVNGVQNYYFYSNKLVKKQVIKGKTVNVHLAICNDRITLGYPIIYGGF